MKRRAHYLALLIGLAVPAEAYYVDAPYLGAGNRAGLTEASFQWRYQGGDLLHFDGDATVDFKGDSGWGFSLGYNFDNHWNLNWEISVVEPDYRATFVASDGSGLNSLNHEATISTNHFNLTYHFTETAVTPFVVAGLGWTDSDSNVADGPPVTSCWWTWYGLSCYNHWSTYDETSFSYNAGLGLRWDINRQLFVRGSYGRLWVDYDHTRSHSSFELTRIELGFKL